MTKTNTIWVSSKAVSKQIPQQNATGIESSTTAKLGTVAGLRACAVGYCYEMIVFVWYSDPGCIIFFIIVGSFWDHFGILLTLLLDILGIFWDPFGIVFCHLFGVKFVDWGVPKCIKMWSKNCKKVSQNVLRKNACPTTSVVDQLFGFLSPVDPENPSKTYN